MLDVDKGVLQLTTVLKIRANLMMGCHYIRLESVFKSPTETQERKIKSQGNVSVDKSACQASMGMWAGSTSTHTKAPIAYKPSGSQELADQSAQPEWIVFGSVRDLKAKK